GVLHALSHIVAVLAVARRCPRVAVRHEGLADARGGDGQLEADAAEAVGIEHEVPVPVVGDLDPIAGAIMDAPRARRAGPGERVERQLALVDEIGRRRTGEDGGGTQDEETEEAEERRKCQTLRQDRKSTRLNSSHVAISYAVFCLKKKTRYNDLLTVDH